MVLTQKKNHKIIELIDYYNSMKGEFFMTMTGVIQNRSIVTLSKTKQTIAL